MVTSHKTTSQKNKAVHSRLENNLKLIKSLSSFLSINKSQFLQSKNPTPL